MTERDEIREDELDEQSGELLPEREAMSVITPMGEDTVMPPFAEEPGVPPPRD